MLHGDEIKSDDELIEECFHGELTAFEQLYHRYKKAMYSISLRLVNIREDAEEVVQDAFVNAFCSIKLYEKSKSSFGVWLKRIVVNKSIDKLKGRRLMSVEVDEDILDENPCTLEIGNSEEMINRMADKIKSGITKLPDGYRTVLSLYLIEGYDHEEIAGILNISVSTSKTQYIRGKQKLLSLINLEQNG